MPTPGETIVVARLGMTVWAAVLAATGRDDRRVVEDTLALNPGLAALGPILPLGTRIVIAAPPPAAPVSTIRLWD